MNLTESIINIIDDEKIGQGTPYLYTEYIETTLRCKH